MHARTACLPTTSSRRSAPRPDDHHPLARSLARYDRYDSQRHRRNPARLARRRRQNSSYHSLATRSAAATPVPPRAVQLQPRSRHELGGFNPGLASRWAASTPVPPRAVHLQPPSRHAHRPPAAPPTPARTPNSERDPGKIANSDHSPAAPAPCSPQSRARHRPRHYPSQFSSFNQVESSSRFVESCLLACLAVCLCSRRLCTCRAFGRRLFMSWLPSCLSWSHAPVWSLATTCGSRPAHPSYCPISDLVDRVWSTRPMRKETP